MTYLALLALVQFSLAHPATAWGEGIWIASPATCNALGTWETVPGLSYDAPLDMAYIICDEAADKSEDRGYIILQTMGE